MSNSRRFQRKIKEANNTINIPVEAMLTPFEFNELFDYMFDYFIYSQRLLVESSGKVRLTDDDALKSAKSMFRAVEKIVPLLEKCGMKNKYCEL
jgi:hypothetical protein